MLPELNQEEYLRYSRHLLLPEVGVEGQRKLKAASVLVVGTGGLGSPVAMYLAAAGVGRIGLVDFDVVDASNLQRQIVHGTSTVGKLKVESARARLLDLNPDIRVDTYNYPFIADTAEEIAAPYDMLVDATDNFPSRYLVNDVCALQGKPDVYGSIFRFEGQLSVFDARTGPCYRCVFPEPPPPDTVPSCAAAGVLGVLPGTIGTLQATEVIKLIIGIGTNMQGRLMLYDAEDMSVQFVKLRKNPHCRLCSAEATIHELIDYEAFCGVPGYAPEPDLVAPNHQMTPEELAQRLKGPNPPLVLDVREPMEVNVSHLPDAQYIPMGELASRMDELDRSREIVVFCRKGYRSSRATNLLLSAGFEHVYNLTGGINAWAEKVDPAMMQY
jgi:adenylyltransferase/sulfurtransferase